MMYNVDDMQVLNDAYANGYTDCEKDHREEWEKVAWRKGFVVGLIVGMGCMTFITAAIILIFGGRGK